MTRADEGLPHSVQVRLARHAREIGVDPNLVLVRFAVERFLYRLSRSRHSGRFVLKGALLMLAWLGETIRPTRDADFLGFGDLSEESLSGLLAEVCRVQVEPDGLDFLPESVRAVPIRPEAAYGGIRATLEARLGKVHLRVHLDVGVGDAVVPEPEWLEYPSLLGFPRPWLRAYRPETVIAEKLHAMVVLGEANSRMRDFFDILMLAEQCPFDGALLARAMRATFDRRRTPIPDTPPLALRPEFAAAREKQTQWQGFLRKGALGLVSPEFGVVVGRIGLFLEPVIDAARSRSEFRKTWPPGGPWGGRAKQLHEEDA